MPATLLIFIPTAIFFAMIPGPDFALILRTALVNGRKAGFAAAIGIGCGLTVHTTLAVLGLSAVIAHSPLLFSAITYAGAAYLAFLGLQALLPRRKAQAAPTEAGAAAGDAAQHADMGALVAFRNGFLTNVLNPKAILFFLTFLPQFVDTGASVSAPMQLLVLGSVLCVVTGLWFALLSLLLERLGGLFARPGLRAWLDRITGAIFLGFGIRLAVQS